MIHPLVWMIAFIIASGLCMLQASWWFQDKVYKGCFYCAWASLLFMAIAFSWAMKFLIKGGG